MAQPPDSPDRPEGPPQTSTAVAGPPEDPQLAQALAAASQPRPPGPSRLTLGLAAALLAVGGFASGYVVGNHHGEQHQASDRVGLPGGFVSGPDGGQPGGGQPPNAGDFTTGTVTKVDGNTVTVKTASGDEVTVKTDSDTDVTITKDGSVSDLSAGDPVVVSGDRQGDGSISADSISEGNNRFALTPGAGT